MNGTINQHKLSALRLSKAIRLLTKKSRELDGNIINRLKLLPSFEHLSNNEINVKAHCIELSDCLQIVAIEQGAVDWEDLEKNLIDKEALLSDDNFLLYKNQDSDGVLNIWFASYEEAKAYQNKHKKCFLFQYKNTFFICKARAC